MKKLALLAFLPMFFLGAAPSYASCVRVPGSKLVVTIIRPITAPAITSITTTTIRATTRTHTTTDAGATHRSCEAARRECRHSASGTGSPSLRLGRA